ncbi:hypothetical protein [Fodinicurvata sp. EGI_FJ10296]|uniref:cell division protein FtsX n=1 Tax=Fodinicurvata sp. EGI_FJ10296 TaxID=3231908 RepID=UPI00345473D2
MAPSRRNTLVQRLRRASPTRSAGDPDPRPPAEPEPDSGYQPSEAPVIEPGARDHSRDGDPSERHDAEDRSAYSTVPEGSTAGKSAPRRSLARAKLPAWFRSAGVRWPTRPRAFRGPSAPMGRLGLVACPIAAMATMALLAILAVWSGESRLLSGLAGRMTVELPATDNVVDQAIEIGETIALLNDWPGILSAEPIERERVEALLAPWFGGNQDLRALPLPALIDVTVGPDADIDTLALGEALGATVADARLDDHRAWSSDVAAVATTLRQGAWAVFLVAAFALFAAFAGILTLIGDIWRPAMLEMHRLGADDSAIVLPTAWNALIAVLAGSGAGTVIGIGLSWGLTGIETAPATGSTPFDTGTVFGGLIDPQWWHMGVVLIVPPLSALFAAVACGGILFHRLRQVW